METLEVHSPHQCDLCLSHGFHRPDVFMFDMGVESVDAREGGPAPVPSTCDEGRNRNRCHGGMTRKRSVFVLVNCFMTTMERDFQESAILSYIGLASECELRPGSSPIEFLRKYLHVLPPHLIIGFSSITTPKARSEIAAIRNRRLAYTETKPKQLAFAEARSRWPHLWAGGGQHGQEAAQDEREWAEKGFLGGGAQQVGKLGALLADYEEEREVERIRQVRRRRTSEEFVAEEEEDSESEQGGAVVPEESAEEERATFERRVKELFIYGLLEVSDGNERRYLA